MLSAILFLSYSLNSASITNDLQIQDIQNEYENSLKLKTNMLHRLKAYNLITETSNPILYKMIEDVIYDDSELTELKEMNFKLIDKIKNIRKTIREINKSMNITKNLIQVTDDELRILLENETNEIVTSNFSLFDNWWEENIERTQEETFLISTDLWLKFKQDNKNVMKDFEISSDKFKQYIKSKVSLTSINLKSKNANCAFEIKGICFKQVVKKELPLVVPKGEETLKLDLELKNDKALKKISNIIKPKPLKKFYFDEELDNKILQDYNDDDNDIINLAEKYDVKTWEIISLLMKYKIINKRSESKGYDKYKETDEYKKKVNA